MKFERYYLDDKYSGKKDVYYNIEFWKIKVYINPYHTYISWKIAVGGWKPISQFPRRKILFSITVRLPI